MLAMDLQGEDISHEDPASSPPYCPSARAGSSPRPLSAHQVAPCLGIGPGFACPCYHRGWKPSLPGCIGPSPELAQLLQPCTLPGIGLRLEGLVVTPNVTGQVGLDDWHKLALADQKLPLPEAVMESWWCELVLLHQ